MGKEMLLLTEILNKMGHILTMREFETFRSEMIDKFAELMKTKEVKMDFLLKNINKTTVNRFRELSKDQGKFQARMFQEILESYLKNEK